MVETVALKRFPEVGCDEWISGDGPCWGTGKLSVQLHTRFAGWRGGWRVWREAREGAGAGGDAGMLAWRGESGVEVWEVGEVFAFAL